MVEWQAGMREADIDGSLQATHHCLLQLFHQASQSLELGNISMQHAACICFGTHSEKEFWDIIHSDAIMKDSFLPGRNAGGTHLSHHQCTNSIADVFQDVYVRYAARQHGPCTVRI